MMVVVVVLSLPFLVEHFEKPTAVDLQTLAEVPEFSFAGLVVVRIHSELFLRLLP